MCPVPLTPKQFDLLVTLVGRAGRLVEKELLLKTVWPDVAVEEGNLTKGVFSLRQLLDEEGGAPHIETVHRRGYRFSAPVVMAAEAGDQPSAAESGAAPAENSIAVMSFRDMSAARDQDFFCEGMSEEIINALCAGSTRRLRHIVIPIQRAVDPQSIGRELMVAWLLEGSVRKSSDMVWIAVQLVTANDGFSAWSGPFDRDSTISLASRTTLQG